MAEERVGSSNQAGGSMNMQLKLWVFFIGCLAMPIISEARLSGSASDPVDTTVDLLTNSPVICAGRFQGLSDISSTGSTVPDCFTFKVDSSIKGDFGTTGTVYILFPESVTVAPNQNSLERMKSKRWMVFLTPITIEQSIYAFISMEPGLDGNQLIPVSAELPVPHEKSSSWPANLEEEILAAIHSSDPAIAIPSLRFLELWERKNEKICVALKEVSTHASGSIQSRARAVRTHLIELDTGTNFSKEP